jgi:prepilin-type N-terminal cleavage/methylation domain-containing protein
MKPFVSGEMKRNLVNEKGLSLIELMVALAMVGILMFIGIPEYNRFSARDRVRSAANELLQNMRLARAMAIKENRTYTLIVEPANGRYLEGFDGNGNGSLLDLNQDGFGICGWVDVDGNGRIEGNERIPAGDTLNADLVPNCVKMVKLSTYGASLSFTPNAAYPQKGPNGTPAAPLTSALSFSFNPNGGITPNGSVYIQHTDPDRGYTYCVRVPDATGSVDLYAWDGDSDNTTLTTWLEVR